MTDSRPSSIDASRREVQPGITRRIVVAWHLTWACALILTVMAASVLGTWMDAPVVFGLVAATLPGLAGIVLIGRDGPAERGLLVGLWSLGAVTASALTGGLAGTVGSLAFIPLAAGLILGGRGLVQAGALGTLLAVGAGLLSLLMAGPGLVRPGLSAISLALVAMAMGAAARLAWMAQRDQLLAADRQRRDLADILLSQPALTLAIQPSGRVTQTHGQPPLPLTPETLLQEGLIATVHAPDRTAVLSAMEKALAYGHEAVTFTPALALDRRIELHLRRADALDGQVRLVGLATDGTPRYRRELALEAARAEAEAQNAGKSRFLAHMSHELRTPLNAVLGFSDIMRQRIFGPLPERYAGYATSIHEAGGHLLALINDVLDVSKIEAERYDLSLERFDAREVLSAGIALVRVQANDKGVALSAMLPGHALTVQADRRALKQMALNLLSNAIKFTPAGGSITVSLGVAEDALQLVVSDTGVGIAEDDLKRLGRPFEQAGGAGQRAQGTGLGLSLVRALAELHGGEMRIASTLGDGATVTLTLPILVPLDRPEPVTG